MKARAKAGGKNTFNCALKRTVKCAVKYSHDNGVGRVREALTQMSDAADGGERACVLILSCWLHACSAGRRVYTGMEGREAAFIPHGWLLHGAREALSALAVWSPGSWPRLTLPLSSHLSI